LSIFCGKINVENLSRRRRLAYKGATILAYHLTDETNKLRPEENEIIRIAWEAVERRREAATKRGKQLQINGTVQENGYAVYKDYNQYMEEKKQQKQLELANWDLRRVRHEIKDTLLSKGWTVSSGHPATRFYPPELSIQSLTLL